MASLSNILGSTFGFWGWNRKTHVTSTLARFQFTRMKHDASTWRDAITEMENAYLPFRVKAQRVYMDTVLNPHVWACMQRRKDQVLLKNFGFFNGEKENEELTKLFNKKWFNLFMEHAIDSVFYGYSLIELGSIINDELPELGIVPRENVSPDRLNAASIVYMTSGVDFLDPSNEYYNWTVWIDTPSERGTSRCGYGLLYRVALMEIYLRALLGSNASYNDKYGMPIRHGKTDKLEGKEYDELVDALDKMGENAYIVTDKMDEIELIQPSSGQGQGYKTYENFEQRLHKLISKVILGHADAMDSQAGRLGAQQGEDNPVYQSLLAIEKKDCDMVARVVNDLLIPKLLAIGFKIPVGFEFRFKNDKELAEVKQAKDLSYKATADFVKTFADAGMKISKDWLEKYTDIEFDEPTDVEVDPKKAMSNYKSMLNRIYPNV